jgi:cytochrome c oxidase subunit II
VIHAWMIPSFGVKQDAIPGFVRDTWFRAEKVGTYRGQCAELCGKEHAFMPIVVRVVPEAEYTAWVNGKKKEMAANADDPKKTYTQAELVARGEKVYTANCVACHQATGKGVPGAFPALAGSSVVADKAAQINILLNGKGAMPKWTNLNWPPWPPTQKTAGAMPPASPNRLNSRRHANKAQAKRTQPHEHLDP